MSHLEILKEHLKRESNGTEMWSQLQRLEQFDVVTESLKIIMQPPVSNLYCLKPSEKRVAPIHFS